MSWFVYIILCSNDTLYAGITTDVDRRFREHTSLKGAKYFRTCRPIRIVFIEQGHSRESASQREAQIKKMKRVEKLQMIAEYSGCGEVLGGISSLGAETK